MTVRSISTVATAIAAAVLAGTALAGATAKDARTLVLQKTDFPRGTTSLNKNGNAQAYGVTYRYPVSGRRNDLTSTVVVLKSPTAASKGFRELKSDYSKDVPTLRLPRYGHEQHISFLLGTAQLIVRKNTIVWTLMLARTGSTGSNPDELTKAEATAELKKYAAKQMRRIGTG